VDVFLNIEQTRIFEPTGWFFDNKKCSIQKLTTRTVCGCDKVFFSELTYTYVETVPAYTVLALMCDIGGALGLILGSTMLTFCELADFLFILATTWIKVRASSGVFGRQPPPSE